ncbi:MAG: hypothetical protein B7Z15_19445, partial [Rhizobiales bacterium 32-66-8]
YTTTANSASNAGGSYTATASGGTLNGAAAGNYTLSYAAGALTVNKAALTVTANTAVKTYDGLAYTGGNGVTYSGFVNNETATVLGGSLAYGGTSQGAVNAGGYVLSASGLTSGNYAISYTAGALTVNTRPITVTANGQSMVYGSSLPTLTYVVGGSGLVKGDSFSGALATTAGSTSNVGAYGITQGTLANSNYALTYTGANVSVTARPITVTADNQSRTFGSVNPVLTWSVSSGNLANGDSLTGSLGTSADATSPTGTYAILQNTLAASSNYRLTFVGGVLTIVPAPGGGTGGKNTAAGGTGGGSTGGGNTAGGEATTSVAQVAQTATSSSLPTLLIQQSPVDQWAQTSQTVALIQESGSGSSRAASSSASARVSGSGCSGSSSSSACEGTPHPDNQSYGRWLTFQMRLGLAQSGAAR